MFFGEYLVTYSNDKITQDDINQALTIQKELDDKKRIGSILVEMNIINWDELRQLLLDYHKHEQNTFFSDLKKEQIDTNTHHPHVSETYQNEYGLLKFGEFLVYHSNEKVTDEHIKIALSLQKSILQYTNRSRQYNPSNTHRYQLLYSAPKKLIICQTS